MWRRERTRRRPGRDSPWQGHHRDRWAGTLRAVSDNELGTFLRTRREAITPAQVGLPGGDRRRTPGLRRSELATLAGISVEYLARIEQGRDRNPSGQVLFALADALRLSRDERHMLAIAAQASGGEACSPPAPPSRSVRPTVQALLDRLEPTPAVVVNRLSDVLAHTAGYELLVSPIGLLDHERPNLVRFVFTDARARAAYPEWDRIADRLVGSLKTETSRTDRHAAQFTEQLAHTAGAPFTDRLSAPPTLPARTSG